jgi:ArsR family transcriptional regulator, arsenate/arsenite/antimonite-responsive transcriptional repressor / arsenate reductase (thioredoxin)
VSSPSQAAPVFVRLASHPLRWRLLTELPSGDLRVRELVALTSEPQNLVSYHLRLLRDAGLVTAIRSSFDGRDSYYHLNLNRCADALTSTGAALHPALRLIPAPPAPQPGTPVAVLFVCTGNSARSPVAEALLRQHTAGRVKVASAGTLPKPRMHPDAVRVLHDEYGIDISGQRPRHLNTLTGRRFDYVITLCDKAREICPDLVDSPRQVHWSVPDPAATGDTDQAGYPAFARAVADIETRIRYLPPVLAATISTEAQP